MGDSIYLMRIICFVIFWMIRWLECNFFGCWRAKILLGHGTCRTPILLPAGGDVGRRHEWWSQLVCAASFEGCTAGWWKARGYLAGGKIQQNWHLILKRFSWLTLIDRNGCGLCVEPCLDINYLATRVRRNPWIVTPWILLRELGFFESPLLCLESPKKKTIQVFSPKTTLQFFPVTKFHEQENLSLKFARFFWLRLRPKKNHIPKIAISK